MMGIGAQSPSDSTSVGPAIKIHELNKWYGSLHVLKDIKLSVRWGEKVVVCGPSGSGKSTLIRCLNQLERHQSGSISIDGMQHGSGHRSLTALRREVGMVFQHFNLFPNLTVLENCMLSPIRVRKQARADAERAARQLLARVRVLDQADKYPSQLSGGQQQRVAIARALCMAPKIMLFDEPTSALDPESVKEVLDVMVELAEQGMTMICVTHEMGFARRVADRVVFMADGQIVEVAGSGQFFDNPCTARAKEFLGQLLH